MKLKDLIKEGKYVLTSTDRNSELPSNYIDFQVSGGRQTYNGLPVIQFIAKTSKDLDKIEQLGDTSKRDICKQLAIHAMKKMKPLKFLPFDRSESAGFSILLDMDFIVKKLK